MPDSRYSDRLNQVMNFAHANSHRNLQLDQLANIACLSKYHFTRIFRHQVGESPISFLKRTRLEKAASLLKNEPGLSILDIALNCGFSSNQLFSRNFGDSYNSCPKQFRFNHQHALEDRSSTGYRSLMYKRFEELGLEKNLQLSAEKIEILNLPPTRVAYIRNIGSYGGCDGISSAMKVIRNWARTVELWAGNSEIIGVSWDFSSITPEDKCRYDACVPITYNFSNQAGVSLQTIPGGIYAVARIPYNQPKDLIPIWKWFSLTIESSPKFNRYKAGLYIGPWYEVYRSGSNGGPVIELYVQLHAGKTLLN